MSVSLKAEFVCGHSAYTSNQLFWGKTGQIIYFCGSYVVLNTINVEQKFVPALCLPEHGLLRGLSCLEVNARIEILAFVEEYQSEIKLIRVCNFQGENLKNILLQDQVQNISCLSLNSGGHLAVLGSVIEKESYKVLIYKYENTDPYVNEYLLEFSEELFDDFNEFEDEEDFAQDAKHCEVKCSFSISDQTLLFVSLLHEIRLLRLNQKKMYEVMPKLSDGEKETMVCTHEWVEKEDQFEILLYTHESTFILLQMNIDLTTASFLELSFHQDLTLQGMFLTPSLSYFIGASQDGTINVLSRKMGSLQVIEGFNIINAVESMKNPLGKSGSFRNRKKEGNTHRAVSLRVSLTEDMILICLENGMLFVLEVDVTFLTMNKNEDPGDEILERSFFTPKSLVIASMYHLVHETGKRVAQSPALDNLTKAVPQPGALQRRQSRRSSSFSQVKSFKRRQSVASSFGKDRMSVAASVAESSTAVNAKLSSYKFNTLVSMDVAVSQPLLVTCGSDNSVILQNYETLTVLVRRSFHSKISAVAIHPTGLFVLLAFPDSLKFFVVVDSKFVQREEISVKACRCCKFARGGQFFACVNLSAIQIYDAYSLKMIRSFQSHTGKISSLEFHKEDTFLLSSGLDGAVYNWQVLDGVRSGEFVQKRSKFVSSEVTEKFIKARTVGEKNSEDPVTVVATTANGILKEINCKDSIVVKELSLKTFVSFLVVEPRTKTIFIACHNFSPSVPPGSKSHTSLNVRNPSSLRIYTYPFSSNYAICPLGSGPATCLVLHETTLFVGTCCGLLFKFSLVGITPSPAQIFAQKLPRVCFLHGETLHNLDSAVTDFKKKLDEIYVHKEYENRLQQLNFANIIKEKIAEFSQQKVVKTQKFEQMRRELEINNRLFKDEIKSKEELGKKEIRKVEILLRKELAAKILENENLLEDGTSKDTFYKKQISKVAAKHEREYNDLRNSYTAQIDELKKKNQELFDANKLLEREIKETEDQIALDIDEEIEHVSQGYEKKLKEEKDICLKLKGENGILRKKFVTLNRSAELQEEQKKMMTNRHEDQILEINAIEKEIRTLQQQIRSKDSEIGVKEKTIYELKKKNQELEKFKFLLDYQIKELKRQVEPREAEILDFKERIDNLNDDLESYQSGNIELDRFIGHQSKILDQKHRELYAIKERINLQQNENNNLRLDLENWISKIQNPQELESEFRKMCIKYKSSANVTTSQLDQLNGEFEAQKSALDDELRKYTDELLNLTQYHEKEVAKMEKENMEYINMLNSSSMKKYQC
eukprot:snap_masked-scaffold_11-processed-gene-11.20-mRNA-1 protein AED:0.36 eAED:0.36 QI:0/-1/0/1/-1/1/1/0/1278